MYQTINKSKKHFIDPKMSLTEVKTLLKETVFSTENMEHITNIIDKNYKKYHQEFIKWYNSDEKDTYILFDVIKYKDKYPIDLIAIPYQSKDMKEIQVMYFCTFKQKIYMVFALMENDIVPFTIHCSQRYCERFHNQSGYYPSLEIIGEMLIYNNMIWIVKHDYNRKTTFYNIVRDGMFICSNEEGSMLRKTFITHEMFRPEQIRLYDENLCELNKHLKKIGIPPIEIMTTNKNSLAA